MKKSHRQLLILLAVFLLAAGWPGAVGATSLIKAINDGSGTPVRMASDSTHLYIIGGSGGGGGRIEKRRKSDLGLEWQRQFYDNSVGGREIILDGGFLYIVGAGWRIEKRDTDGVLQWRTTPINTRNACSIAADNTYLYISGMDDSLGHSDEQWYFERRNKDTLAVVDWSQTYAFGPSPRYDNDAHTIVADNNYIYIAGWDSLDGYTHEEWRIERRRKDNGDMPADGWSVISDPANGDSETRQMIADTNYLYIIGYAEHFGWRIEKRNKEDCALEWAQGSESYSDPEAAQSVTSDGEYLYIIGYDSFPGVGDHQWRIEKRYITTGELVWKETFDFSSDRDKGYAITCDDEYIYLGGRDYSSSDTWRIEKRTKIGFIDIGLRVYNSNFADPVVKIAAWPLGEEGNSPLRVSREGDVYGIALVDVTNPSHAMDSGVRINIPTTTGGIVKALMRYE